MEWWNDGLFDLIKAALDASISFTHYSIVPTFQYSKI
jgi:hypothetical protein